MAQTRTRFKVSFLKVWQLQHQIHKKIAIPYMVFWICQLVALPWSIESLLRGLVPDMSDPRLERIEKFRWLPIAITFVGSYCKVLYGSYRVPTRQGWVLVYIYIYVFELYASIARIAGI